MGRQTANPATLATNPLITSVVSVHPVIIPTVGETRNSVIMVRRTANLAMPTTAPTNMITGSAQSATTHGIGGMQMMVMMATVIM